MKKNILLLDTGGDSINFVYEMIAPIDVNLFIATPQKRDWMTQWVPDSHIIECDVYEYDSLLQSAKDFLNAHAVTLNGVGTYYDSFVTQMAKLSKEFNTANISIAAAEHSSADKFKMRQVCTQAGVAMPKFLLIENATPESLLKAINTFGAPCVVKPIMGWKSFGVKKFEGHATLDDVQEVFTLTSPEQADYFKNFSHDFLVEEYLSGPLVSVDGYIQNGKTAIAGMIEFVLGPEPHFTVEHNYIPTRLDAEDEQNCIEYTQAIIEALQFDNCGFHCELRLTENGPRLIEIACRLPGGPLQLGYRQAYGYNLASNLIDIWLGVDTQLNKTGVNYVAQKAIYVHQDGILQAVTGMENLDNNRSIWAHAQITAVGKQLKGYPDAPEPIYFYAAQADTPKKLAEIETSVEANINITVQ